MAEPYLPEGIRRVGARLRPFGVLILLALLLVQPTRAAFSAVVNDLADIAGAPSHCLNDGQTHQVFQTSGEYRWG